MRAQVSKWGNSLAIRLPKSVVESLEIREGAGLELVIEGDRLIVRAEPPRYTLEELVAAMRPGEEPGLLDDVSAPPMGDELL